MNSKVKAKIQKYRNCGVCSVACGVVLIVIGAFIPATMTNLIQLGAEKSAALTEVNEPMWNGIPG